MARSDRPPKDWMDPIPDTVYPEGSVIGNFDGSGNPYEKQELLHRPHAFALMHGDGGAKVAYGELHWRVDVFKLQFRDLTVAVAAHSDHTHGYAHTHTVGQPDDATTGLDVGQESSYGTTDQPNDATTGLDVGQESSYGTTDQPNDATTGGADPEETTGSATHVHTHEHGHTHTVYDSHNHEHDHTHTTDSQNTSTSDGSSATLTHTVTTTPSTVTYCDQASQEAISQITQTVPKVDADDGDAMDATIPNVYHQLSSYGDVYLVWDVDLELTAGSEITDCWVQVGAPSTSNIGEVAMGNATTNRRNGSAPTPWQGTYAMKLGAVNENDKITQNVSGDVVWTTTVLDRVKV